VRGRLAAVALTATLIVPFGASAGAAAATTPAPVTPLPGSSSNPLSPGIPASPATPATSSTPTVIQNSSASTTGGSTFSSGSALLIAIGAVVLLGGISFFIWRDARRRAPQRGGEGYEIRRSGTKRAPKPRKPSAAERKRRKRGRARR
jgi:hypothetical protein